MKLNGNTLNNDNLYTMVGPKLAEEILTRNTLNRPMRTGHAEKLAREMAEGRWRRAAQPVLIGEEGALYNGQHTLWAVVLSGMTVPLIIIHNVPRDALAVIDTGLARNYADYKKLSSKGTAEGVSYPNELAAALRHIHWYETQWPLLATGRSRSIPSHQELDILLEKHPKLPEFISHTASSAHIKRLGSIASTAFVYAMAAEQYPEQARSWLEVLKTGDAPMNHPANILRERLTNLRLSDKKITSDMRYVFLVKSWNAMAQSKALRSLRWLPDEPLPAIFGTPQYTGARAGHTAVQKRRKEVLQKTGKASFAGKRRGPRLKK